MKYQYIKSIKILINLNAPNSFCCQRGDLIFEIFPSVPAEVGKLSPTRLPERARKLARTRLSFRLQFSNPLGTAHKHKRTNKIVRLSLSSSPLN